MQLEIHDQSSRQEPFLPDRNLERLQACSESVATGSQRTASKEVAVRQESGHLSGQLSTEKLSQPALRPILCRLQSTVLVPSWRPQNSTLQTGRPAGECPALLPRPVMSQRINSRIDTEENRNKIYKRCHPEVKALLTIVMSGEWYSKAL